MGALMDRSTDESTGTCPKCQGRRFTIEHIPNTFGYLKRACPLCGPKITFKIPGITDCATSEQKRNERNRRLALEGGV
jgi:hypothetical protein